MGQYAVIGLGNFGYYLSIYLNSKGHEVIGVDINEEAVNGVKDTITHAVIADSTDKITLERLNISQVDAAIVCIGSRLEHSILTVQALQEVGVKSIIAKTVNISHAKILKKMGVDKIIFPERDQAVSLGKKLCNGNIIEKLPLGCSMIEIDLPENFKGKSLKDLDLINRYSIQIVGVKRKDQNYEYIPTAELIFEAGDKIIALGKDSGLELFQREEL